MGLGTAKIKRTWTATANRRTKPRNPQAQKRFSRLRVGITGARPPHESETKFPTPRAPRDHNYDHAFASGAHAPTDEWLIPQKCLGRQHLKKEGGLRTCASAVRETKY